MRKAVAPFLAFALPVFAADLPLQNPGFEDGLVHWVAPRTGEGRMNQVLPQAARSGALGLLVVDRDLSLGSELLSEPVPVIAGKKYRVRFHARYSEGSGVLVYLVFRDADQRVIRTLKEIYLRVPETSTDWTEWSLAAAAPDGAAFVAIRIHSAVGGECVVQFDDFSLRLDE